jgi:lysophospholipase L1-like esterase
MVLFLELFDGVGTEPAFIHQNGVDVPNPQAGAQGPITELGLPGLKIDPAHGEISQEEPNASRIIPGTRIIETNSQAVADMLAAVSMRLETGGQAMLLNASQRAQAQALQTLLEPLVPTITEEAASTVANPVVIPALSGVGGPLNPAAPWAYQMADMGPKAATEFALPLQPYVARNPNAVFPYQIMFDFDGQIFGMNFSNGEKNGRLRIWANDLPSKYLEMPKRAAYFLKCDFGSRAKRPIIIECDFNVFLKALIRSKTDSIMAPSEYGTRSFAVMGDSFGRGSGILFLNSEATASSQSYAFTLARLLGFTQTRNWSVPGTGFTNSGGGAGTYAERLASCLPSYKPNVLLLQQTTNDHPAPAGELEAAIAATVAQVRAESPTTKIVGCTPMPVNDEGRAENAVNAEAGRKAFTAAGVPFVDGYKAEWITGTGKVGATTGVGNSDFYSSSVTAGHPSPEGHDILARNLAAGLAPILGVGL